MVGQLRSVVQRNQTFIYLSEPGSVEPSIDGPSPPSRVVYLHVL